MTSEDLPGDRTSLTAVEAKCGVARGASRWRAQFARVVHFARRQWLSWRVGWAARHRDPAVADAFFAELVSQAGGDSRRTEMLAGAALRAARSAEARGYP